ncbi:hypothetical protein [Enterococcus sp. JNUCC 77]
MENPLKLRLMQESKSLQEVDKTETLNLLGDSKLIKKLTHVEHKNLLTHIWNLIGLAEIPNTIDLPYTQNLVSYINKHIATEEGFSYTGIAAEIVPCYNALIFEAYCRLGLGHTDEAQAALNWIKQYQVFDRVTKTTWPYEGICKHGGCMKNVPCFIGIGKTVRALITYRDFSQNEDTEVNQLIQIGLDYMMQHHMFQRLSNQKPISPHITDIMFPQSYVLSLTDIVYIIGKTNSLNRPEILPVLDLLKDKQTSTGGWKIDYIYSYQGYVPFDNRRKDSEWITSLFLSWLGTDVF